MAIFVYMAKQQLVSPSCSTLLLECFSHQCELMVFPWCLRDIKSPQVSRNFLSIQSVLNIVIVWIVSTRPLISKSSSPFNNHDGHFHVPQFLHFPSKVEVLILHFTFFQFYSVVSQDGKIHNFASPLFLLIIWRPGLRAKNILFVYWYYFFYSFESFSLQR